MMAKVLGIGRNSEMYRAVYQGDLKTLQNIMEKETPMLEHRVNDYYDTLLHVAISTKNSKIADELLDWMESDQLEMQNSEGDTPLHTAAANGLDKIAGRMVEMNGDLVNIRNHRQEIPLHKAALSGCAKTFWDLCNKNAASVWARREDGTNVLHCAVMGNYFELAVEIAKKYSELRAHRDHQGMTPLHLLVTNPMAFKSGSELGTLDAFIYRCIIPDEDLSHSYDDKEGKVPEKDPSRTRGDTEVDEDHFNAIGDEEDPISLNGGGMRDTPEGQSQKSYREKYPANYVTCINGVALLGHARHIVHWTHRLLFVIFSRTYPGFKGIENLKKKHHHGLYLVKILAEKPEYWSQLNKGRYPGEERNGSYGSDISIPEIEQGKSRGAERGKETPLILATIMGAVEFVNQIITGFSKSANFSTDDGRNYLQIAVEQRQGKIVELVESIEDWRRMTVSNKDKNSDTILHSVARLGKNPANLVSSSALQMLRELQWFERVRKLLPLELVYHRNLEGETAQELFTSSHEDMMKSSKEQLVGTAQACSALVAAVVFATSFSIPGGTNQYGEAVFLEKPAFKVFTNAYVIGLSTAATALLLFVSLLISPYHEKEFRRSLPTKFMLAFTALFLALMSMVVAFSSNIYLTINGKRNAEDIVPLVCELAIFPAFAFAVLLYQRAGFGIITTLRDVLG